MKRNCSWRNTVIILGLILGIALGMSNLAVAKGLPKVFAVTAYGTTSSGYASMVGVGNALSEDGYKMRVLPAKNDISRMLPLKTGRVQFTAQGVGVDLAQEGLLDFADTQWGPEPVRLVMACWK